MNIFEDLIEELKEENLLETVAGKPVSTSIVTNAKANTPRAELSAAENPPVNSPENLPDNPSNNAPDETAQPTDDTEFYRKRAMEEVSFLQTVEYVFAGIEREHLKIVPKPYDALEVKKNLHSFVQISHAAQPAEHARAQFQLLQETESWHSSLALRDRQIMTAHLRRYCEMSRPPLSSPALIALARFYRNSTYTESVRSKFDLVITRLFSRELAANRRETIFKTNELAAHLADLYADWSSVPLYSTDADDAKTRQIVENFAAFIAEADGAAAFDELIKSSFFKRLHQFKESTGENFFAPRAAAVAVESNVRIGNRYLELLENEKSRGSIAGLENKYGYAHDQSVSEATGKTFALIELLNQKTATPAKVETPVMRDKPAPKRMPETKIKAQTAAKTDDDGAEQPKAFDKRLILLVAGVFLIMAILYFNG